MLKSQRALQAQLTYVIELLSYSSLTIDTRRGLHALYSRTNAPVYHDGLAPLWPGAFGQDVSSSPHLRACTLPQPAAGPLEKLLL